MKRELFVCDHQSLVAVPPAWLVAMEQAGGAAAEQIVAGGVWNPEAPLVGLECIDVALVDDAESERVHREFMGIDGPTDVITFEHGEIVIGVEVAKRQAAEYGEPELRELLRYLVHGLLHLAGHDDQTDDDRERMQELQEGLVARLWEQMDGRC